MNILIRVQKTVSYAPLNVLKDVMTVKIVKVAILVYNLE
jgi:hypothetical protein